MKYFVLGMLSSDGILCAAMLLGVRKLMYKVHSRKKGNNSRTERNVICIKISILKWDLLAQGRYRTPWLYLASTTNYISMPATCHRAYSQWSCSSACKAQLVHHSFSKFISTWSTPMEKRHNRCYFFPRDGPMYYWFLLGMLYLITCRS